MRAKQSSNRNGDNDMNCGDVNSRNNITLDSSSCITNVDNAASDNIEAWIITIEYDSLLFIVIAILEDASEPYQSQTCAPTRHPKPGAWDLEAWLPPEATSTGGSTQYPHAEGA